jgi:serine-type D-Ala-D-Ala carboxypeptidase/endopeptidase (penicillin-binding protein 4)
LYGEALLRAIAYQKTGRGNNDSGIAVLKNFWKTKTLLPTALNLVDGSGLSPLNRITTRAQVAVLQYAKKQPWFPGFYNSLPEYNGMKIKSGTINNVKGFAGYHTSRAGVSYTISFLVNNYNGSSSTLVKKMYAVLDILK